MARLLDASDALRIGDILRLPENYDLEPGSGPVDLMVCELNEAGPALLTVSGQKAGLVFAVLPAEARSAASGGLRTGWLRANWERWFRFTYRDAPVPAEGAKVLRWDERRLGEAD